MAEGARTAPPPANGGDRPGDDAQAMRSAAGEDRLDQDHLDARKRGEDRTIGFLLALLLVVLGLVIGAAAPVR